MWGGVLAALAALIFVVKIGICDPSHQARGRVEFSMGRAPMVSPGLIFIDNQNRQGVVYGVIGRGQSLDYRPNDGSSKFFVPIQGDPGSVCGRQAYGNVWIYDTNVWKCLHAVTPVGKRATNISNSADAIPSICHEQIKPIFVLKGYETSPEFHPWSVGCEVLRLRKSVLLFGQSSRGLHFVDLLTIPLGEVFGRGGEVLSGAMEVPSNAGQPYGGGHGGNCGEGTDCRGDVVQPFERLPYEVKRSVINFGVLVVGLLVICGYVSFAWNPPDKIHDHVEKDRPENRPE